MKPKAMVLDAGGVFEWKERSICCLSFIEVEDLIHNLQNALFDLRNLERATGKEFYIVLRE